MKKIKAWTIKKKHQRGYIWRTDLRFYEPIKYALFRTQKEAWEYMKARDLSLETHTPEMVLIDIKEA